MNIFYDKFFISNPLYNRKKLCIHLIGSIFVFYFISSYAGILNNRNLLFDTGFPNLPGCNPAEARNKIVFLRTFKSGTSTLYRMLQQYIKKFNLTEQEVDKGKLRSGPFNRNFTVDSSIKGDVLMDHIIWNRDEVVAQMGPNFKTFTILRNPYDLFESFYSFGNLTKLFGMNTKEFVQFLHQNDPMNWLNHNNNTIKGNIMIGVYDVSLSRTLGMPMEFVQDDVAIDNYIAKIEKDLDLVMITEKMEESLILFRYLMCWSLEDTVVFDHNVRSPEKAVPLNEDDKKELAKWLKADLKIYNYFYEVLAKRMASYPGNMALEIQRRLAIREERRKYCLASSETSDTSDVLECHGYLYTMANTRQHPIETGPNVVLETGQ